MRCLRSAPALFAGLFFCATWAVADQAYLKDGSVLVGDIQHVAEAKLHFKTSFGADLAIPWEQVTAISTEGTVVVALQSGDRVVGVLEVAEGQQFVRGSALGDVPVKLTDVSGLWPEGAAPAVEAAKEAAVKAEYEGKIAELEAQKLTLKQLWTGRAELGVNGQSGNQERIDVRGSLEFNRKSDRERLNVYLKGQYAETNSLRSANEIMGGTRLEVDFSERTYVFGKVDLEYDEFENLDLRATLTAGLGHFFIKREKIELKGWVGVGYEHETFEKEPIALPEPTSFEEALRQALITGREDDNNATSEDEAVVELGYSYRHDFKTLFRFKHGLTYYPSISEPFEQYRLAADTALEFPIGKESVWTLRTGVRHEYDSEPHEGVDELDTTYFLNLGYNW